MPGQMFPNYDYDIEQQNLARRQQIAEAMQQGALAPMGPTEVVSGMAVRRSPLEGIAKILQAYMASKSMGKVREDQVALGNRYREDLKTGMSQFMEGMNAQPGQPTAIEDESGGHTGPAMTPVDVQAAKRSAILNAIASNHPVLQQLGMSQMNQLGKDRLTMKDVFDKADPTTQQRLAQQSGIEFTPARQKPLEVNGMLIDPTSLKVLKAEGEPPKHIQLNGDYYEINPTTGQYKKLDNAPKLSINGPLATANAGQKKGMETIFSKASDHVAKLGETAAASTELKQSLAELRNLESQGINSGVVAPAQTWVQNFAQSVGIPLSPEQTAKLGSSEGFNSVATQLWQNVISKSGGNRGVTKEEAAELKNITPQLANSPQARVRMMAILERAADRSIAQHKTAHTALMRAIQADDATQIPPELFSAFAPEPTTPQPATQPGPQAGKPIVRRW